MRRWVTTLVALVACGDADGDVEAGGTTTNAPAAAAPIGVDVLGDWEIAEVTLGGVPLENPNAVPSTLLIEPGGLSGDAGCNRFFGEWVSTIDGIEIGALAITEMGCLDTVDWFELLDALTSVTQASADGEERVLSSADGATTIRLVPPGPSGVDTQEETEETEVPTTEPDDSVGLDGPGDAADYIGLTEAEAGALAAERGFAWRVEMIDGEPQALTMDFVETRRNFSLEAGIVVSVSLG